MVSYPVEIRRCQHVKTNGTQCGSPALRDKPFCFFHSENRPKAIDFCVDGETYSDGTLVMPVFEDAHSIQVVIRQVTQLLLQNRIGEKTAGLLLYALQIASGNLKQMAEEKARPTQVVVDPEKVAETPIGMTPWSAGGSGHDEEEVDEEESESARLAAEEELCEQRQWADFMTGEIRETIETPDLSAEELKRRLQIIQDRLVRFADMSGAAEAVRAAGSVEAGAGV
ncbi:MAG: hypothetical protein WCC04_21315 [Terriglobales bacterium]